MTSLKRIQIQIILTIEKQSVAANTRLKACPPCKWRS